MTTRCNIGIHSLCLSDNCDCPCHAAEPEVDTTPLTPRQRIYTIAAALAIAASLFVDGGFA